MPSETVLDEQRRQRRVDDTDEAETRQQQRRDVGERDRAGRDDDDDRNDTILDRQPAPVNDPVDKLSREETLKALGAAVDRLAPRQRAAVLLRVQEDMATYEIAGVLKCSEATVRVHLHRALATLKKTVEKR